MGEEEEHLLEISHVCQDEECEQGSPAKHDEEGEQHQETVSNPIMGQEGQNPSTLAEEAEEAEQAWNASSSCVPTTLAGGEDANQSHSQSVQQSELLTHGLAQEADGAACVATDSQALIPKAKPGFLAKAVFCAVTAPVLVPIVALGTAIQWYEALSLWGALPPSALQ